MPNPVPPRFWVIDTALLGGLLYCAYHGANELGIRLTIANCETIHELADQGPYLMTFGRVIVATLTLLIIALYRKLQAPLFLERPHTEPRASRGQRPQDFPPAYPNGWFLACLCDELRPGEVKELNFFGSYQVLFRTKAGKAAILDAACPHLGANLAIGGSLSSHDCLRCPFHGWEFDTTGKCTRVEGTDTIPANSSVRSWPTKEVNGGIFVWHHAEGIDPEWDLPVYGPVESGRYFRSGTTYCQVHAHVQELPENGPDSAHLNVLHRDFVVDLLNPFGMRHYWSANWAPHPTIKHMSQIFLSQGMALFGVGLPGTSVKADINQIGPGIVKLTLTLPIGEVIAFEYVTPSKPTTLKVRHAMYCSFGVPRWLGKITLWALEQQFHRDVPIWEAKKYLPKPAISKADGPIPAFRRWYSQFYCAASVPFVDAVAKEHMLEW